MTSADINLGKDIRNIINNGCRDENPRPKYKDGAPAYTYFVNHVVRSYDLSNEEFPICTLRPIAWKSAINEVMWIFQDQSNSLDLLREKYGIHIWDEWESKDIPGTIGIRYGETIRRHDLVDKLILGIKGDPYGRRHKINLWQEDDFEMSDGLMPCCYETQWNVRGEYLDMLLNQRSGDMITASGAGGWNEVQYMALQMMIAKATGYKPGKFTHVIANEQIYNRHIKAAFELLHRHDNYQKYTKTNKNETKVQLKFTPSTDNFYSFTVNDFEMIGYNPIKPQLHLDLGI